MISEEKKTKKDNKIINLTDYKIKKGMDAPEESSILYSFESEQVYIAYPTEYKEVQIIADKIMKISTVIIDLRFALKEERPRIMNFIFGICYAYGGTIRAVSDESFVVNAENCMKQCN